MDSLGIWSDDDPKKQGLTYQLLLWNLRVFYHFYSVQEEKEDTINHFQRNREFMNVPLRTYWANKRSSLLHLGYRKDKHKSYFYQKNLILTSTIMFTKNGCISNGEEISSKKTNLFKWINNSVINVGKYSNFGELVQLFNITALQISWIKTRNYHDDSQTFLEETRRRHVKKKTCWNGRLGKVLIYLI